MPDETTDILVIGTGFGGAIPGYHLAAGGARVVMLERGPRFGTDDFTHSLRVGDYTRILDLIVGDGVNVLAGNCVGGGSVVYFGASLRAPSFVFERTGTLDRRLWPESLTRQSLNRWYRKVERALPVRELPWNHVPYAGGVWAAACDRAGHTCNPVPVAIDLDRCTNCNWMQNGCSFDAKRSMLLNYIPAAEACGAEIRPLHQVESISPATTPGYRYAVSYLQLDPDDYSVKESGRIEAKIVILAAGAMGTPVILKRSEPLLGPMPAAVGQYFSPNGDRLTQTLLDEEKVHSLLDLERKPGVAYQAFPIGKSIATMTFDFLDEGKPEFSRFSLQQIYLPPFTNILSEDGVDGDPVWFGVDKKALTARWRSWLQILAMTEDANEGFFGPPPPTGNFTRLTGFSAVAPLSYRPTAETTRGWAASDEQVRAIVERDGLGKHLVPRATPNVLTAHPLSTCRIGDDPTTSALDDQHELRNHPGIFVTDGSAVPTSLCVNPSLTIAALAERASMLLLERAGNYGVAMAPGIRRLPTGGPLR